MSYVASARPPPSAASCCFHRDGPATAMPHTGSVAVWETVNELPGVPLQEARTSPAALRIDLTTVVTRLIFAIAIIAIASFHTIAIAGVIVPLSHVVAACRTRLMWRQAARPDQAHVVC